MAAKHPITLFFDTYERTGDFLDDWLRQVVQEKYGSLSPHTLIVVAGQKALDLQRWAPFEGLIARLPLEPFTEKEARDYLARQGVTHEQVIDVILRLSERLPLWVATMAAESPDDPDQIGDPCAEATEWFLRQVKDPQRHQAALDGALPRRLNRDVLALLVGEEDADLLFDWLRGRPFVQKRGEDWIYHSAIRGPMLRYKRQRSATDWAALHARLAEHYERLRDDLGLGPDTGRVDQTWQTRELEALYHRLCQAPEAYLLAALKGFLAALDAQFTFAFRWVMVMAQVVKDTSSSSVLSWVKQLIYGLKAYYDEEYYQVALDMFTALLEEVDLPTAECAIALRWRGQTCLLFVTDRAIMGHSSPPDVGQP